MLRGQFQRGGSNTNYESNPELRVDLSRDGKRLENNRFELVQELSSCATTIEKTRTLMLRFTMATDDINRFMDFIPFALKLLHTFSECEYTFARKVTVTRQ